MNIMYIHIINTALASTLLFFNKDLAQFWAVFYFYTTSKIDYNKVPKDIEGQTAHLKERNLIIPDESKAAKVLAKY